MIALAVQTGENSPQCLWMELRLLMPNEPVLPNLRRVRFHPCIDYHGGPVKIADDQLSLLSPTVREIEIPPAHRWDLPRVLLHQVFASLCRASPNVEVLTISWDTGEMSKVAQQLPLRCLRSIKITHPVAEIDSLAFLANLPLLQELWLNIDMPFQADTDLSLVHLETLTTNGTWQSVRQFLEGAHLPSLRILNITNTLSDESIQNATAVLHAITHRLPHLTALHCHCRLPYAYPHRPHLGTPALVHIPGGSLAALLTPILPLRALQIVSFVLRGFLLPYTSADLRAAADAWPALSELCLEFGAVSDGEGCAGLEALAYLARACPHLRVLHLPVLVLRDPRALAREEEGLPAGGHGALRELELERVDFGADADQEEMSRAMTAFVMRVFPRAAGLSPAAPEIVVLDEETGGRSRVV